MARAAKKKSAPAIIVFSRSRDIPFNRIHLSADNVREVDVEAGLDELTQDIDRRVRELGRLIGYGVTLALQPGLTPEDAAALLG